MHQTGVISALGEDLLDAIFLAEGLDLPDVLDRHALFGRNLLRVSTNGVAERLNELRVVEQPDPSSIQLGGHRFRMADARNRALDDHTGEAREHATDVVVMTLDQVRHRPTIRRSRRVDLPLWFEATPG